MDIKTASSCLPGRNCGDSKPSLLNCAYSDCALTRVGVHTVFLLVVAHQSNFIDRHVERQIVLAVPAMKKRQIPDFSPPYPKCDTSKLVS